MYVLSFTYMRRAACYAEGEGRRSGFDVDQLWLVCISSSSDLVFSAGWWVPRMTSKRFWELPNEGENGGCASFVWIAALSTNPQRELEICREWKGHCLQENPFHLTPISNQQRHAPCYTAETAPTWWRDDACPIYLFSLACTEWCLETSQCLLRILLLL